MLFDYFCINLLNSVGANIGRLSTYLRDQDLVIEILIDFFYFTYHYFLYK